MEHDEDEIEPVHVRPRKRHKSIAEDDEIQPIRASRQEASPQSPMTNSNEALSDDDDLDDESVDEHIEVPDEMDVELMKTKGFSWAGILESVQLDRFMSHECFEYKLGPNVNVVNGANGSGKSAIVAALQIGLGAKANATERGSKMQDHIMHGKDSAIITIRIHNRKPKDDTEPDMTFRYDVYGPKIIIERRLIRKGSTTYSVKNWQGKHVDLEGRTPRTEIRDIIDHFGFMVENPVAILTQTKSKAFLAKCRPSEHFQLYKAATLLGPLEDELNQTVVVANKLKIDLSQKKKNVPVVEKDLENLERAHNEAQELKNIGERIAEAQTLFAWTVLAEAQDNLDDMTSRTENEFQPAAAKADEEFEQVSAKVHELNSAISSNHEKVKAATEASNQSFEAVRDCKRAEKTLRLDVQRHEGLAKDAENEIHESTQNIDKVTQTLTVARLNHVAGQGQKEAMEKRLEEAVQTISSLEAKLQDTQQRESHTRDKHFEANEKVPRASDDLQTIRRDFEQKRQEQMSSQGAANQGNDLFRFGNAFPALVQRIRDNRNLFHEEPIGPIGHYIKVREQDWAPAIESYLGMYTLQSFLVHDAHDASVLQRMLPNHPRPTIVVSNLRRQRYNIREQDIPQVRRLGHCTMLDMLNIEHDAVFNTLVDQNYIERMVLVGTVEDITELGWSRLLNLVEVWNKKGERAYSRNGSNTFRKPAHNMRSAGRILMADRTMYLRALENEVRSLEDRLRHQQTVVKELENRARALHADVRAASDAVKSARRSVHDAQDEKRKIEEQIGLAASAFNAAPYEEQISLFNRNLVDAEKRRDSELKYVAEFKRKVDDLLQKSQEAATVARAKRVELQKLMAELEEKSSGLAQERARMQEKNRIRGRAKQKLQAAQQEIAQKRADVAEKMDIAMGFGDRPDGVNTKEKSSAHINRRVLSLKERLQAEQERRGGKSADDIETEYLHAKKKYREMKKLLRKIESYDHSLQNGIVKRLKQRKDLERVLRKSVRHNFNNFLGARGHSGNIRFGRNEKGTHELVISTKMASHQKGDGGHFETKDLRSLSGGERSFTTLAFMLALAEVTQNPIRVMDEIDVFQDEANRRASFKTLVEYCSSILTDKQFVIITPLALPDIQPSDCVRIVKLKPPRPDAGRGEQTRMDAYMEG